MKYIILCSSYSQKIYKKISKASDCNETTKEQINFCSNIYIYIGILTWAREWDYLFFVFIFFSIFFWHHTKAKSFKFKIYLKRKEDNKKKRSINLIKKEREKKVLFFCFSNIFIMIICQYYYIDFFVVSSLSLSLFLSPIS